MSHFCIRMLWWWSLLVLPILHRLCCYWKTSSAQSITKNVKCGFVCVRQMVLDTDSPSQQHFYILWKKQTTTKKLHHIFLLSLKLLFAMHIEFLLDIYWDYLKLMSRETRNHLWTESLKKGASSYGDTMFVHSAEQKPDNDIFIGY